MKSATLLVVFSALGMLGASAESRELADVCVSGFTVQRASVQGFVSALRRHIGLPISLEWKGAIRPGAISLEVAHAPLSELLEDAAEQSGLAWTIDNGVVNLYPKSVLNAKDYPLNAVIMRLNVNDATLREVLAEISRLSGLQLDEPLGHGGRLSPGELKAQMDLPRVTFSLSRVTVRQVLNRLAVLRGEDGWTYFRTRVGNTTMSFLRPVSEFSYGRIRKNPSVAVLALVRGPGRPKLAVIALADDRSTRLKQLIDIVRQPGVSTETAVAACRILEQMRPGEAVDALFGLAIDALRQGTKAEEAGNGVLDAARKALVSIGKPASLRALEIISASDDRQVLDLCFSLLLTIEGDGCVRVLLEERRQGNTKSPALLRFQFEQFLAEQNRDQSPDYTDRSNAPQEEATDDEFAPAAAPSTDD